MAREDTQVVATKEHALLCVAAATSTGVKHT